MARGPAKTEATGRKPQKPPNADPYLPDVARRIESMAAAGLPLDQIATIEDMDPKTLRKRYGREYDRGFITGNTHLARAGFQLAVGRPAEYDERNNLIRAELPPDKSVNIFMHKARLGYRDVQVREVKGEFKLEDLNLSALSSEELKLVLALLQKAQQRGVGQSQPSGPSAAPAEGSED